MECDEYLRRSRLFRLLRSGPHGQLVERYAARLVGDGLVRHGTWRCFNVVGGLLSWIASRRGVLADLDERMVEQYLRHRAGKQSIQPGDRSALKRWLSVLREESAITWQLCRPLSPHTIGSSTSSMPICGQSAAWPRSPSFVISLSSAGSCTRCAPPVTTTWKRDQSGEVIRYIERHARVGVREQVMCWSLRAFLRYLHHQGLNPRALADCVPSMRRWKLASLPTFCPPHTGAEASMVATGQPQWDGGTTPF